MGGHHVGPTVRPLIHLHSVLAKTERLSDMIDVDKPPTTGHPTVESHFPSVDNPPPNVDEHARSVDSRRHNILWLINGTER